ncbi:MAG TPA: DUF1549 domain-containing protein [Gemmataceae bacterium]|nr:DUF1549 domain-containing protein [Gemmataceae bacterium]
MLSLVILSVGLVPASLGESPSELAAWIDARLESARRAKGQRPLPPAGDDVFLRRAYLELTGAIPSVAEARDFLDSTSAGKRERLIHSLLDDKRFPEHQARLWARTLAPAGNTRRPLEAWLRDEFRKNTPFDQVAKDVLTAKGNATTASPAAFYFAVGNSPERVAEAVARGLLGVRLGCAQCHNHPFTSWKREDFWGLAAFFAGTGTAPGQVNDGFTTKITPSNGTKEYEAKFLEGPAPRLLDGRSPRAVLAEWLVSPKNRFFAANVVNRVWQDLCGSGLVSTIDDLDTLDAADREQILDSLAAKFAANGFDLRWLIEGICLSKAYQQASTADPEPGSAQRPVRTLSPDQVFAALDQALSLKKGRGLSPRYTAEGKNLMARLDEARGSTPTDFKGGIPQALLLMNGPIVSRATTLEDSLTLRAVVEAPFLKEAEKLDTLFLAAYSRMPRAEERARLLKVVRAKPDDREAKRQAYANIFWALLNSPEFLLCP